MRDFSFLYNELGMSNLELLQFSEPLKEPKSFSVPALNFLQGGASMLLITVAKSVKEKSFLMRPSPLNWK